MLLETQTLVYEKICFLFIFLKKIQLNESLFSKYKKVQHTYMGEMLNSQTSLLSSKYPNIS